MNKKELIEYLKKNLKLEHEIDEARYGCPTTHKLTLKLEDEDLGSFELTMDDMDKDYR